MGAISGILIAPVTAIYYDTGFLIGLKGFVGAIIGAPSQTLSGGRRRRALLVGLLEVVLFPSGPGAYKRLIVFTLIIRAHAAAVACAAATPKIEGIGRA